MMPVGYLTAASFGYDPAQRRRVFLKPRLPKAPMSIQPLEQPISLSVRRLVRGLWICETLGCKTRVFFPGSRCPNCGATGRLTKTLPLR
jgi:hypothetical protein